jgi:1,4-alpha-glucan branching enzyme
MVTKVPSKPGKVAVTFSMPASIGAKMFHVVGDFNDWSTTATPLNLSEEGWCVSLELDAGRSYQYRYLVDGRWFNDWKADGYEPNEHGGDNSVVVTVPHYERESSLPPRSRREPRSGKPVLAYT